MHSSESVPMVRAVLERGTYSWIWVVPTCPYCGRAHEHAAGPLDGDPYAYLGGRVAALCEGLDPRYFLADQPTPDAALPAYILTEDQ